MAKENHDPTASLDAPSKGRNSQQMGQDKLNQKQQNGSPNKMSNINNATDLFELLERCQSSRLDDQRCVLPSYFSQVSYSTRRKKVFRFLFIVVSIYQLIIVKHEITMLSLTLSSSVPSCDLCGSWQ